MFWAWIDRVITTAMLRDRFIQDQFGWRQLINNQTKTLTIQNFRMQAGGASAMMLSAIVATESGLMICCPVHDAFLLLSRIGRIDADVATLRDIMTEAGRQVAGIDIRTDVTMIHYPDRYSDKRGVVMWQTITDLVGEQRSISAEFLNDNEASGGPDLRDECVRPVLALTVGR